LVAATIAGIFGETRFMNKTSFYLLLIFLPFAGAAQKKKGAAAGNEPVTVGLSAGNWAYKEGKATFITHKSRPAMKIILDKDHTGTVLLKDLNFADGTIEYDMELADNKAFAPIYFRWQDTANHECFYLRNYRAGNAAAHDAVQYAPIMKGAWLWDLYFEYQNRADFKVGEWNHVKLVVSGKQMRVYVNSSQPTLQVPRLEADLTGGALGFDGNVIISNLVIRPNQVEGLAAAPGSDITDNDPRYLRNWQVSVPLPVPKGVDYSTDLYPAKETVWESIEAERKGMVSLSRRFGKSSERRLVWLKTTIQSAAAQRKELALGFSDDVWVFLNGSMVYADKNTYNAFIRKEPDGRISVDNATVPLALQQGDNELLIGVANNFFGWGLIARLSMKETDIY
jgi:hypothetical protein